MTTVLSFNRLSHYTEPQELVSIGDTMFVLNCSTKGIILTVQFFRQTDESYRLSDQLRSCLHLLNYEDDD